MSQYKSLTIDFERIISDGLADLISVQKSLKYLCIAISRCNLNKIQNIPSLITRFPNTVTKLDLYLLYSHISLSFIVNFTNLQELQLSFYEKDIYPEGFKSLQYAIFPHLRILKIHEIYPGYESLMIFLQNNGKILKELYLDDCLGNHSKILSKS